VGGDLVGDLERGGSSDSFSLTKQDERKARCKRLSGVEDEQHLPLVRTRDRSETSTHTPSLNSNEEDKHSSAVRTAQNMRVEFDSGVLEPTVIAPQVPIVASPQLASARGSGSPSSHQHASPKNQTSSATSLGNVSGDHVDCARPPALSTSATLHMSPTQSSSPARLNREDIRRNKEALRAEISRVRFTDARTYKADRLTW